MRAGKFLALLAGSALAGFGQPASAQLLLTGVGGKGGGASVTYDTARGAYVPRDSWFGTTTSLVGAGTDTQQWTVIIDVNCQQTLQSGGASADSTCNQDDLITQAYATYFEPGTGAAPGHNWSFDNNPQFSANNSAGSSATDGIRISGDTVMANSYPQGPHRYTFTGDNSANSWLIAIDDKVVGSSSGVCDGTCRYASNATHTGTVNLFSAGGLRFINGSNGTPGAGTVTAAWVGTIYMDTRSIQTAGALNAGILAKLFQNGKGVSLGADGSALTGLQPAFYFNGDGAALAVNKGSVNTTTYGFGVQAGYTNGTGTRYTNYWGVSPMPYAMWSGLPAGQPTLRWMPQATYPATTSPTTVCKPNGLTISTGDALICVVNFKTGANTAHSPVCPSGGPTTWTCVDLPGNAAGDGLESYLIYGIAGAGETGNLSLTWSNTAASITSVLLDYGNVSAFGVVGGLNSGTGSASTLLVTPSLTTTGTGSTLVSIFANWDNSGFPAVSSLTNSATKEWRFVNARQSGIAGMLAIMDEYGIASGSSTARTLTMAAGDYGGKGFSIELKP